MAGVVVIWGLGLPIGKLISAPPLVTVSLRFWISAPIVLIAARLARRSISLAILRRAALAGTVFGANLALTLAAMQHASVAVVSVVMALLPGVVLLCAGPLLHEWPTLWHVLWTMVGICGVALVILGDNDASVSVTATGVLLATGTLATFSAYHLINRRVGSTATLSPVQWMGGVTIAAAVTVTPVALLTSSPSDYREFAGADWLYLGFLILGVGIIGHAMMSWAHQFIPAGKSSLQLLAMNVIAIFAAWPIHDEPVTVVQMAGAAIVFGALAVVVATPVPAARAPDGHAVDMATDGSVSGERQTIHKGGNG